MLLFSNDFGYMGFKGAQNFTFSKVLKINH